ncbi:MAG: undecaprenyldiphospho-muramoylpentapeptide beta-N-acetylglucosaminyltransferase [Acidimicrobiaceae bacterium]|nr:undecaprenyldiphospho-muramoylpentapeptide beta-N-acetylglucosaminyltransferase [Acidimicrobiaceae bacterium]
MTLATCPTTGSGAAPGEGRSGKRSGPGPFEAARPFAVISGGGTGGHVIPAVAIGQAMVEAGHPAETIHFVGARRGMERDLVPAAGFGVTLLPGRGIVRRVSVDNIGAIAGLAVAFVQAVVFLARRRPRVVVSVGGFASAPCVFAAWLLRIPVVVAEQNAVPGLANRLAARVARAAAVSFPGTPLPRAILTGNPVRTEMVAVDRGPVARSSARAALGLPEEARVVLVAGGSLGARRLNTATIGLVGTWTGRADVAVRHILGARDWEDLPDPRSDAGPVYQRIRFEDRMDLCYSAADVAVHRAGASTVAELTAAGVPSILIPLPGAPGDHQTANAARLAEAGAAVVVPDADLDADRLALELDRLLGDEPRLSAMGDAAHALARPRAAAEVAALAERFARPGPGAAG